MQGASRDDNTDVSLSEFSPRCGFFYLDHPESFQACLSQVNVSLGKFPTRIKLIRLIR